MGKRHKPGNSLPSSPQHSPTSILVSELRSIVDDLRNELSTLRAELCENKKTQATMATELEDLRRRSVAPAFPSRTQGEDGPPNQVNSTFPYGHPPQTLFHNTIVGSLAKNDSELAYLTMTCDILRSASLVAAKNFVAVVEHLSDDRSRKNYDAEKQLCESICSTANIAAPVTVWRHETRNSNRARPTKVKFASVDDRDAFLRAFYSSLPADFADKFPGGRRPICRRDMSPHELQLLYRLRKKCWEMNQTAGKRAYVVRDLQLVEYKPRRTE